MTPDWPRGGYAAGDTPASELKPPPPNMVSKQTVPDRSVTPDLPIPEAAIEAAAQALFRDQDGDFVQPEHPWLTTFEGSRRAKYTRRASLALEAALPHLRSLQVETQVRGGRELGRREAQEECAAMLEERACQRAMRGTDAGAVLLGMATTIRSIGSQAADATSEPRTGLPVGPSHPHGLGAARKRCPECGFYSPSNGQEHHSACPHSPKDSQTATGGSNG